MLEPQSFTAVRAAAPFVNAFRGRLFVVKLGGELLDRPRALQAICEQLAVLHAFGVRLLLVHGGGPQLDRACAENGITVHKSGGRRVTGPDVLAMAKRVIGGELNMHLTSCLRAVSVPAVGLTGVDGGLLTATRRPTPPDGRGTDYGLVGDLESVDSGMLDTLVGGGFVPVVAPLSAGADGTVYNTNADTVAAWLAAATKAAKLFFLVDVPGILADPDDPASLVAEATVAELDEMADSGTLRGGMLPKLAAARHAIDGGVERVHLISGGDPEALLAEVLTNQGSGTMITARPAAPDPVATS